MIDRSHDLSLTRQAVTDRLIRATHNRPNEATFTRGFTASNGVD